MRKVFAKKTVRYASTLVTHTIENPSLEAKEVAFNLLLPDTAFVSRWEFCRRVRMWYLVVFQPSIIFRFAMMVGEEVFLAEVQEKEKALETYNEAVDNGQSAGESNFDDFS